MGQARILFKAAQSQAARKQRRASFFQGLALFLIKHTIPSPPVLSLETLSACLDGRRRCRITPWLLTLSRPRPPRAHCPSSHPCHANASPHAPTTLAPPLRARYSKSGGLGCLGCLPRGEEGLCCSMPHVLLLCVGGGEGLNRESTGRRWRAGCTKDAPLGQHRGSPWP